VFGFAISCFFQKVGLIDYDIDIFEKIGFSILNGMISFSTYVFLLGIFNIRLQFYIFIPIWAICVLYFLYEFYNMFTTEIKISSIIYEKINYKALLLSLVLVLTVIYYISYAYTNRVMYPDEYSLWALNAKNIFLGKNLTFPLQIRYSSYPDLLPILYSGYYIMIGSISDNAIRVIPSIFLIGLIFNFIGLSKRKKIRIEYVLLFFIGTMMFYTGFSSVTCSTYADIPFGVLYSLSIIYLLEWLVIDDNKTNMLLSIIYANGACFTKVDGLPMMTCHLIIIVLYFLFTLIFKKYNLLKPKLKKLLIYFFLCLILGIMWKLFLKYALISQNSSSTSSSFTFNIQYLVSLLTNMSNQHLNDLVWNICTFIFFISLIFNWKGYSLTKKIYIFLGIFPVIFTILFMFVAYLTQFGFEAVTAASYIRYLTRVIFVYGYIMLYSLDNK
jgi:hypothetical protein